MTVTRPVHLADASPSKCTAESPEPPRAGVGVARARRLVAIGVARVAITGRRKSERAGSAGQPCLRPRCVTAAAGLDCSWTSS